MTTDFICCACGSVVTIGDYHKQLCPNCKVENQIIVRTDTLENKESDGKDD